MRDERPPPSDWGVIRMSLQVMGLAWRLIPANLCGQTALSVLQSLHPMARSSVIALLINDIVSTPVRCWCAEGFAV